MKKFWLLLGMFWMVQWMMGGKVQTHNFEEYKDAVGFIEGLKTDRLISGIKLYRVEERNP